MQIYIIFFVPPGPPSSNAGFVPPPRPELPVLILDLVLDYRPCLLLPFRWPFPDSCSFQTYMYI